MNTPAEPLEISAPLARRLAAELCGHASNETSGESCAWSHGFWQYLRLMQLVTSPEYHADFYHSAFAQVTGVNGAVPRVLISGAADYGMLAQVLAAFRGRGVEPEVTVIDLCETPLALNRWYALRAECELDTCQSDVLDYIADAPFDAVCTDSFFGRLPLSERHSLVARWHALLRPGGLLITVNRLRPKVSAEPVSFTPEQAASFQAMVKATALALPAALGVDAVELEQQAGEYAKRHHTHSVRSLEDLRGLFEGAGFLIEHLSAAPVPGGNKQQGGGSGPSVRGDAEYAKVIARREA